MSSVGRQSLKKLASASALLSTLALQAPFPAAAWAAEDAVEEARVAQLLRKAEQLFRGGDSAEARALLEEGIKTRPGGDATLPYRAGEMYFRARAYHQALEWTQRAADLHPGDVRFVHNLAYCYLAIGDVELGLHNAQLAVTMEPEAPEHQYMLGVAHVLNSDGAAAVPILEKWALSGDDHTARYALAAAYRMVGRERDAQETLREAQRLERRASPQSSKSQEIVETLDTHHTDHLTVHLPRMESAQQDRVLAQLEEAYARVAREYGCEPDERIDIAVFPDEETFEQLYGKMIFSGDLHLRRLIISSPSFVSDERRAPLVVPGMRAVVAESLSDGKMPYWLRNGIRLASVNYYGKQTPYAYAYRLKESKSVPLDVFELLPYESMYASKTAPYFATRYLIKTYGPARLGALLNSLRGGLSVEQALRDTYALDYASLTEKWQWMAESELKKHERDPRNP